MKISTVKKFLRDRGYEWSGGAGGSRIPDSAGGYTDQWAQRAEYSAPYPQNVPRISLYFTDGDVVVAEITTKDKAHRMLSAEEVTPENLDRYFPSLVLPGTIDSPDFDPPRFSTFVGEVQDKLSSQGIEVDYDNLYDFCDASYGPWDGMTEAEYQEEIWKAVEAKGGKRTVQNSSLLKEAYSLGIISAKELKTGKLISSSMGFGPEGEQLEDIDDTDDFNPEKSWHVYVHDYEANMSLLKSFDDEDEARAYYYQQKEDSGEYDFVALYANWEVNARMGTASKEDFYDPDFQDML